MRWDADMLEIKQKSVCTCVVVWLTMAFPGEEGADCCTVRICCPNATFSGTPTVFWGELGGWEATDTTVSCLAKQRSSLNLCAICKTLCIYVPLIMRGTVLPLYTKFFLWRRFVLWSQLTLCNLNVRSQHIHRLETSRHCQFPAQKDLCRKSALHLFWFETAHWSHSIVRMNFWNKSFIVGTMMATWSMGIFKDGNKKNNLTFMLLIHTKCKRTSSVISKFPDSDKIQSFAVCHLTTLFYILIALLLQFDQ